MLTWILTIAWPFIKLYKNLFIYAALALMVAAGLVWVHHDGYEKGIAKVNEVKKELAQEKAIHMHDVQAYRDAQDAVKDFNEKKIARMDNIIDRNNKDYNVKLKRFSDQLAKRQAAITPAFIASDRVVAPVNFRVLYNSAVGGYYRLEGTKAAQENRPSPSGEVESFGADSFTQVTARNIEKYNALALRCDKLIDQVNEQESDGP